MRFVVLSTFLLLGACSGGGGSSAPAAGVPASVDLTGEWVGETTGGLTGHVDKLTATIDDQSGDLVVDLFSSAPVTPYSCVISGQGEGKVSGAAVMLTIPLDPDGWLEVAGTIWPNGRVMSGAYQAQGKCIGAGTWQLERQ